MRRVQGNPPTAISIDTNSRTVLAANSKRISIVFVNTSSGNISLAFGHPAVLNSGVTLPPGGTWMPPSSTFTQAAISAIAALPASNLSVQEYEAE